jgi:hypothetical protein
MNKLAQCRGPVYLFSFFGYDFAHGFGECKLASTFTFHFRYIRLSIFGISTAVTQVAG